MTRRTLVTGATGFVGSHVTEALLEAGHDTACTVRASSDLRWIEGLDVSTVPGDLRRPGELDAALEGVGTVVHAAGATAAGRADLYREVNVLGTERLARRAAARGVERFVFVSSLAARGPDGAPGPASPYGRSKREAEDRLDEIAGGSEMEAVVLRPAGVYGPRDTDVLLLFWFAARGWLPAPPGGGPLQPVYARDVAHAVVRACEAEAGFGPHPVAERDSYGWSEVRALLEEAVGRRVRRVPVPGPLLELAGATAEVVGRLAGRTPEFDRRRARDLSRHTWTCDPRPTEEALGWRAETPLAEGMRKTVAWYRREDWL